MVGICHSTGLGRQAVRYEYFELLGADLDLDLALLYTGTACEHPALLGIREVPRTLASIPMVTYAVSPMICGCMIVLPCCSLVRYHSTHGRRGTN